MPSWRMAQIRYYEHAMNAALLPIRRGMHHMVAACDTNPAVPLHLTFVACKNSRWHGINRSKNCGTSRLLGVRRDPKHCGTAKVASQ